MSTVVGQRVLGGLVLLLPVLAAVAGCGGKRVAEVSGKVTYKNQPLPDGTVTLMAQDGQPYSAQIQADGTFTISNVPVGPAKVVVTSRAPDEAGKGKAGAQGEGRSTLVQRSEPEKDKGGKQNSSRIPLDYNNFDTSGLTAQVEAPVTQLNLDLK
jgi:hypothetical protein